MGYSPAAFEATTNLFGLNGSEQPASQVAAIPQGTQVRLAEQGPSPG